MTREEIIEKLESAKESVRNAPNECEKAAARNDVRFYAKQLVRIDR
jgi:hypothetical protein